MKNPWTRCQTSCSSTWWSQSNLTTWFYSLHYQTRPDCKLWKKHTLVERSWNKSWHPHRSQLYIPVIWVCGVSKIVKTFKDIQSRRPEELLHFKGGFVWICHFECSTASPTGALTSRELHILHQASEEIQHRPCRWWLGHPTSSPGFAGSGSHSWLVISLKQTAAFSRKIKKEWDKAARPDVE